MIKEIYIQMKDGCNMNFGSKLRVKDVAIVVGENHIKENILNLEVLHINDPNKEYIVVSTLTIIDKILKIYGNIKIFPVGETEMLIKVLKESKGEKKIWLLLKLCIVCMILFIGSGVAIMNFHADVNMTEAHKQMYKLITGTEKNRPLILQIPYSLGIGLGMAMFFNHILPKRFDNEVSPLEVKIAAYRKSINQYILNNDKKSGENNK